MMGLVKNILERGGIRSRVIGLMGSQVLIAVVCIVFVTVFMINRQIGQQTTQLFHVQASALNSAIEQRIDYLIANTELLAANELMVNALSDTQKGETYLPQLVMNFIQGKDVVYLNVVDFDGRALFETHLNGLTYNDSEHLRQALALNKSATFIDAANHLIVISPVKYFDTPQGALVVAFDFTSVVDSTVATFS
ncbi:MAG: cache domain-containing protein, partial [Pontibacterium sp.]